MTGQTLASCFPSVGARLEAAPPEVARWLFRRSGVASGGAASCRAFADGGREEWKGKRAGCTRSHLLAEGAAALKGGGRVRGGSQGGYGDEGRVGVQGSEGVAEKHDGPQAGAFAGGGAEGTHAPLHVRGTDGHMHANRKTVNPRIIKVQAFQSKTRKRGPGFWVFGRVAGETPALPVAIPVVYWPFGVQKAELETVFTHWQRSGWSVGGMSTLKTKKATSCFSHKGQRNQGLRESRGRRAEGGNLQECPECRYGDTDGRETGGRANMAKWQSFRGGWPSVRLDTIAGT